MNDLIKLRKMFCALNIVSNIMFVSSLNPKLEALPANVALTGVNYDPKMFY